MNAYETSTNTFLASHDITCSIVFVRSGPMWNDKEFRDIYAVTFKRPALQSGQPDRILAIDQFGQSLAYSRDAVKKQRCIKTCIALNYSVMASHSTNCPANVKTQVKAPTAYDVLACLQKYDPGTFEDWCRDMDWDTDSRKALDTYLAVQAEWRKVWAFFSNDELSALREIN